MNSKGDSRAGASPNLLMHFPPLSQPPGHCLHSHVAGAPPTLPFVPLLTNRMLVGTGPSTPATEMAVPRDVTWGIDKYHRDPFLFA
jgi:hypothetical protein